MLARGTDFLVLRVSDELRTVAKVEICLEKCRAASSRQERQGGGGVSINQKINRAEFKEMSQAREDSQMTTTTLQNVAIPVWSTTWRTRVMSRSEAKTIRSLQTFSTATYYTE